VRRFALLTALLLICALPSKAQDPAQFTQGFNAYQPYDFDGTSSVNLSNFNLFLHIPLASYPQRGTLPPITFFINYNNFTWYEINDIDDDDNGFMWWQPEGNAGAYVSSAPALQLGQTSIEWDQANGVWGVYSYYQPFAIDGSGAVHDLYNAAGPFALVSTDGSDINVPASCTDPSYGNPYSDCKFLDSNGNLYAGPQGWSLTTITDPNGNTMPNGEQWSWGLYQADTSFVTSGTDSLGRVFPNNHAAMAPSSPGCYPLTLPGQNGGTLTYSLCYANISVSSPFQSLDNSQNFGWSGSVLVLTQIVLPNNASWSFSYDGNGNLTTLTLPTGGSESYSWTYGPWPNQTGGSGTAPNQAAIASRSENANDGTAAKVWQYGWINNATDDGNTVTDPDGNYSVHSFFGAYGNSVVDNGYPELLETESKTYAKNGSGYTLLKRVDSQYPNISEGNFVLPSIVTTTWPATGQVDEISYTYDNANEDTEQDQPNNPPYYTPYIEGKVIEKDEYDYGSGTPGALLRRTLTSYLWQSNSSYWSANLLGPPTSVSVENGAGGQAALTNFGYDESPSPSGVHGNQTSVHRWLSNGAAVSTANCSVSVSSGGYLTSYTVYNSNGTVNESTDSCGQSAGSTNHTTTYGYSSSSCPSGTGYAGSRPVTVTNALGQTNLYCYDISTALLKLTEDPNGATTTYTYNDSLNRLTSVSYPDGGSDTFSYNDTIQSLQNPSFTFTKAINSGLNLSGTGVVDGLGRKIRTAVTNGESVPFDQADTCYDNEGRVAFKSYPYQGAGVSSTTRFCSGAGDSLAYDPLNRITTLTHSDGSTILTSYADPDVSVSDEGNGAGRLQTISQMDGLGRLTSVCEVTSTTLIGITPTPASCGLDVSATGFLTTYTYDTLDDLISVTQGGLNPRSFQYDSLSRMTSATNPESGTITRTLDANGNTVNETKPAPNQTGGATVTLSYCYDSLNRMTSKAYTTQSCPMGSPVATYAYDQISAFGVTLTNSIGRLSSESTTGTYPTGSVFSYDSMGRVVNNSQCTPQNCGTALFALDYTYDLAGDTTSSTNGMNVTFGGQYNAGTRLTELTSSLSGTNHPATLLGYQSAVHYNAAGSVLAAPLGNGITETRTYDSRLRPTGITATLLSTNATVYQTAISSYAPNSNLISDNDSVNGNWTYAYDALNRLIGSNLNSGGTIYSYAYDRFGNRWSQTATPSGGQQSLGFNANNQIVSGSGVTYDAAGNTTDDGITAYAYDAEDRIISATNNISGTSAYVYDAGGRRVRKTTSSGSVDYLYDLGGNQIVEVSSAGVWNRGEVYVRGRHLATYSGGASGTTYFIHSDWLGTERARTTAGGAIYETCTSLPFGDGLSCSGSDPSPMHFTGKQLDAESGLEYFGARYDAPSLGRFMSADVMHITAHLADPQSFNRYTYARNNPLVYVDPDGKDFKQAWNDFRDFVLHSMYIHYSAGVGAELSVKAGAAEAKAGVSLKANVETSKDAILKVSNSLEDGVKACQSGVCAGVQKSAEQTVGTIQNDNTLTGKEQPVVTETNTLGGDSTTVNTSASDSDKVGIGLEAGIGLVAGVEVGATKEGFADLKDAVLQVVASVTGTQPPAPPSTGGSPGNCVTPTNAPTPDGRSSMPQGSANGGTCGPGAGTH
jgi:RHS repeat-associated protein